MKQIRILVICVFMAAFVGASWAGTVHVKSYTRKDGTYVHAYDRKSSGSGSSSGAAPQSYSAPISTPTYRVPSYALPSQSKKSYSYLPVGSVKGPSYSRYTSSSYAGARDSHGRILRSASAKRAFMKQTGYPHGRPGYVVDHIIALKHGGADDPSNMQWQTISEAKAKDKWE